MIKIAFKKLLRHWGYEIQPYNVSWSSSARLNTFLKYHNIDLVLDVGANTGQYASTLRDTGYTGEIISFEPLPHEFELLQEKTRKDGNWSAFNFALGDIDSSLNINVAKNSVSSSFLPIMNEHCEAAPESVYTASHLVDMRSLDTIFDPTWRNRRILMKIDTQGYEELVIEGGALELPQILALQVEMSLQELYEGAKIYKEIISLLNTHGFDLCGIEPGFSDPTSGAMLQFDGYFLNGRSQLSPL
ncbi:MAG: FkbM family methyltransferase [Halieaceae bacterium]